ncbi:MAG: hypothetical protein KUG61_05080, partial [Parvibaculaceae bacterium]|nr:hypothetical protein [Parvibaculaceae bacterium]
TVDKAFVYGSKTMDRHLTYVAMTRHRHEVGFYSSKQEFGDQSQIPQILAKARMQRSALEFLENREHAPQLDKAAWMQAFYERQKEKLARLTARFDQIVAKVLPQRSVKAVFQDAAESDHILQTKLSAPTPASASERHRFSHSQMSSKDASELKASLLRKEVVSEAIQRDVSVVRAHKSVIRSAGYISPQFQAEIRKIPVEQLPSIDMNKVSSATRLNDRGLELMARAASTLDGTLNKALIRHVASVNTVIDTLSKPLPELSIRAQNFIIDCENTTDKAQLKSLYQALGPHAREVRLEIGDYMTGLRNRVEVTQSVEIAPKLAAALLPIKPTALNAASFKASVAIKQGLSATLRRGIDLTR